MTTGSIRDGTSTNSQRRRRPHDNGSTRGWYKQADRDDHRDWDDDHDRIRPAALSVRALWTRERSIHRAAHRLPSAARGALRQLELVLPPTTSIAAAIGNGTDRV